MALIKIDGRAISNHWMLLQDIGGSIFDRVDIPLSYPSPSWYFNGGLDFPSTQPIPTFDLPDGTYQINPQGSSNFTFDVVGGQVDYSGDCEGFLTGRGTDTLMLNGYTVTIDARYLMGFGMFFNGVFGFGPADPQGNGDKRVIYETCTLLPGNGYYFVIASAQYGDFNFDIGKDGRLNVDAKYAQFTEIEALNTLIVKGFPVLIDGRLNGTNGLGTFGIYGIWDAQLPDNHTLWSDSKVVVGNFFPILEGHGYMQLYAAAGGVGKDGFRVDINGNLSVSDPSLLKIDTFNGMRRVTVLGDIPSMYK